MTVLAGDMNLRLDLDRAINSYLKQFNSIYYRFGSLDNCYKFFLFKTFTSFYGSELWYDQLETPNKFNKIAVCYHKTVKKLTGLNVWESNHDACSIADVLLFKHYLALSCLRLYLRLCKNTSPCTSKLKYYFKFESVLSFRVKSAFDSVYGIDDLFGNCMEAIKARINFVQRNEPRSSYVRLLI